MKYAFNCAHREEFGARAMYRVLRVHFSDFYAWLKEPLSYRSQEDVRQTELIRRAGADIGMVCGYRKLTDDLRDKGERIMENRVTRLASLAGIAAQVGYKRRPHLWMAQIDDLVQGRLQNALEDCRTACSWLVS